MDETKSNTPPTSVRQRPAGLLVRAVQPKDAEAVAELMNLPGYRWGTLRLPFQTPDEVRARIEKAGPNSLGLVALANGQVVGNAGLERSPGRRAHVGSIGMGVHDSWVGRSIGKTLLTALLEAADNWLGVLRLELTVWTDNEPALALYQACGFVIEGTHRAYGFRDGRYADAHTMARLRETENGP